MVLAAGIPGIAGAPASDADRFMRSILLILFLIFLFLGGCYTMLRHPEIEAYYDDSHSGQSFVEEFNVVVDEDCRSCHADFIVTRHFAPVSPAHQEVWSHTPWWFDDNYKSIFGSPSSTTTNEEYESAESPSDESAPAKSPPAYIRSPRTPEGDVSSRVSKSSDPDSTRNSAARNETERKTSDGNRRKFRKRN